MKIKKAIVLMLAVILMLTYGFPSAADELTDAQKEKEKIDNQINNIAQQKKQELTETQELEQEKNAILSKEDEEKQKYEELMKQISEINGMLNELNTAIEEAEKNYQDQLELFQTRLRTMYINSGETTLDILLQSKNITDFLERLELISLVSLQDKKIMEELSLAKQEVEYKRQLKEQEKIATQKIAQEKKDQLDTLIASRSNLEEQIRENKNKISILEKQEKELLEKSKEIGNLIQTLSRRSKYVEGQMVWPLQYTTNITSSFGNRLHPILRIYTMHTGIDIGGKSGESILAANDGTVIISGWQSAYGYTVVLDHGGGITTLYAHCSKILVTKGDEVKVGQIIAKVGSTGWSTGPHLHFEVRVNGEPQNPLNYVKP